MNFQTDEFFSYHRGTMERHTFLLLVGILILAILFFVRYHDFILHYEGFTGAPSKMMAQLPKPEGTSTVPNTMPGAVTRNPTEELASFKDIAALLDTMKTYNALYEMFLLNLVKKTDYTLLHTKSVAYSIKLQAQIDTGKIVDSLKFITTERRKYKEAIEHIRRNEPLYKGENLKKAKKVTKNLVSERGPVKVADLKHAITRAKNEQKRIDDIRSEAPDFKQRSLILERIQLDLQQIHDKILRKDMSEAQIPISKRELLTFLVDIEDPTSKISPLPRMTSAQMTNTVRNNKKPVQNKSSRGNVASNFEDYPEDKKIIAFLETMDKKQVKEGFTNSPRNENDLSDADAQAIEEAFTNMESQPATGYVGDENDAEPFTPSNKLEQFASYDSETEEGFSNYTNNFIHDAEDRDEAFRTNSSDRIKIPPEYKKALSKLRSSMRDLTWDMQIGVGYDPNVTTQRRITERLNSISNEIESGRLSRTKLKAKFMELDILKQQLETYNRRSMASSSEAPEAISADSRYGSANTSDNNPLRKRLAPEYEMDVDDSKPIPGKIVNGKIVVQQEILADIDKPLASNDFRIRPGYEMSTDEIAKRGSRASFDYSLVGGPDYKKNVKFLCSQIKAAGLGEPREFGCIANQEEDVGPEYSWKGNYKMVCARLGNTWGEWYPEMFGCPKPETSHSQMPKINADCSSNKPPPLEHPPKPTCGVAQ
jgi:hypothetical protein